MFLFLLPQIDWDKEDGVEALEEDDNDNDDATALGPGAQFAAQAAATTAAGLDLPPPPHQTFDEAERLEALKDLPPGLWDKHEFVAGTYGVGGTGGADGQVACVWMLLALLKFLLSHTLPDDVVLFRP